MENSIGKIQFNTHFGGAFDIILNAIFIANGCRGTRGE